MEIPLTNQYDGMAEGLEHGSLEGQHAGETQQTTRNDGAVGLCNHNSYKMGPTSDS